MENRIPVIKQEEIQVVDTEESDRDWTTEMKPFSNHSSGETSASDVKVKSEMVLEHFGIGNEHRVYNTSELKTEVTEIHNDAPSNVKVTDFEEFFERNKNHESVERIYHCVTCGMSFTSLITLRKHLVPHKKPYRCTYCDKSFSLTTDFKIHVVTHVEKPFKCEFCETTFALLGPFITHLLENSTEGPHTCGTCGKSYPKMCNLRYHTYLFRHN